MGSNVCEACGSLKAWGSIVTPVSVLVVMILAALLGCRLALALAEFVFKVLGYQIKICFAQAQILAQIPVMLGALLPTALEDFFEKIDIVNMNPLQSFGMSCSDSSFRKVLRRKFGRG